MGGDDLVEDVLELELEERFELGAGLDAFTEGALAKVFEDDLRGGGAYVGGEEQGFERIEGGLVDLAGEGDNGVEGLGEGLAGAGDGLPHAVEEARFGRTFRRRERGWRRGGERLGALLFESGGSLVGVF